MLNCSILDYKKEKLNGRLLIIQGTTNPPSQRLLTIPQAAHYLGRTVWSMRGLIWKGSIPVVREKDGRRIFLDIHDLDDYVTENKTTYL